MLRQSRESLPELTVGPTRSIAPTLQRATASHFIQTPHFRRVAEIPLRSRRETDRRPVAPDLALRRVANRLVPLE